MSNKWRSSDMGLTREYAVLKFDDAEIPVLSFIGEDHLETPAWFDVTTSDDDWPELDKLPLVMTLEWQDRNGNVRQ